MADSSEPGLYFLLKNFLPSGCFESHRSAGLGTGLRVIKELQRKHPERISHHKVHGGDRVPVKHVKTHLTVGSSDVHRNSIKRLQVLQLCAAEIKGGSNLNQRRII